ncbi:glycoside hydrolase family 18 protein [Lasiosphaeris hirsuta]|uniref:Glycoside hydrolase family 18 protein n=1 Tax=Lasiosphaeris hirsuta TaxID=260670 RepID=A0AA40E5T6_9PEZI|nr:glycoside hydrolase family 18 protein [Lasiosphaeris hirsuta]
MKAIIANAVALLGTLASALPAHSLVPKAVPELPRLVLYYQTTHDSQSLPISMLPLITEKGIALTHLIVCSFHVNYNGVVHLNDYPPGHPHFYTMWNETLIMKEAGVKIMGMVGGAAAGSFDTVTLDGDALNFELYYRQLRDVIAYYGLQGMDLDVEQPMSQAGITRLVQRLRADFGPDFEITLAPVASALVGGANLSGFNYKQLETAVGADIDFYNAQFYNGFGYLGTTTDFGRVVSQGWNPRKILAGQITTSDNGAGYIPYDRLNATISALRAMYGQIGGIMGWEYFNSQPGGLPQPWQWAQAMTAILRPNEVPRLTITKAKAKGLIQAWKDSVAGGIVPELMPNVDYMAMVNA